MNTTNSEGDNNLKSAQNYCKAMLAKDFDKMASYLHDDVHFVGPIAKNAWKRRSCFGCKEFRRDIVRYSNQVAIFIG